MILTQSPGARAAQPGVAADFHPMATIERLTLENPEPGQDRWDAIAAAIVAWAARRNVALRDAVVLLPFAQLLPLARRAFARVPGWMPRIETTQTLAASLGPPVPVPPGQIAFDVTTDGLNAAALLASRPWGAAWARRDPRAFEQAVAALVATAHELARASFARPVHERAAHWNAARDVLVPIAGPGATERLLARVALEWAAAAPAPATERLFSAAAPSAWIAVQAGGVDPLTQRLLAESTAPCLTIDTDAAEDDPFRSMSAGGAPTFAVCDGFEHEAQCAAAQVLAHLQRGETPVALIAQDRVLMRRVRALLEREPLRLLDETGWKLSTTRAAAQVMALLQAARADASTDALLDWLKAGGQPTAAVSALEATCRRAQTARMAALDGIELEPAAARLWATTSALLRRLASPGRQHLPAWLAALAAALADAGALAALQADDAGRQVIAALRLLPNAAGASAWASAAGAVQMDCDAFVAWVDSVLERATYVPSVVPGEVAQVVITPLARAMLRPFAALVFPGADDKHLGATPPVAGLLGDVQAAALGVPTFAQRRSAELRAFVHALAAPHVTFLRRRTEGNEPLADSPLLERLRLALEARGAAFAPWHDPRLDRPIAPAPIRMSAPAAAGLLPAQFSASACEALRACPYRFFTLNLLRLREHDELEREVEKRDYGTWLHAVLYEFHRRRGAPDSSAVEVAQLLALAAESRAAQASADADFLPFAASFASFAPRYIAWLHARDADGAQWLSGEDEIRAQPVALDGVELRGIVDRIDSVRGGIELIDYKTGGATGLREKVRQPLEDTQLAFYAALVRARSELPLQAVYLALDGSKKLEEVRHPNVDASAAALVDGLAHDLRRLRAGAGLPALGEGATCEHCAARGVCRRDHWEAPARPGAPQ